MEMRIGDRYIHKDGGIYKIEDVSIVAHPYRGSETLIWYARDEAYIDKDDVYVRTERHFNESFKRI